MDINSDNGFEHNYTYKGYRYDKETGLYFLNERYYAAGIGRFLTKDVVLGALNDTQSLNKYAYALGDPVNLKDDGGLYAMPANYSDADPNVQSYSVQRQNNFVSNQQKHKELRKIANTVSTTSTILGSAMDAVGKISRVYFSFSASSGKYLGYYRYFPYEDIAKYSSWVAIGAGLVSIGCIIADKTYTREQKWELIGCNIGFTSIGILSGMAIASFAAGPAMLFAASIGVGLVLSSVQSQVENTFIIKKN